MFVFELVFAEGLLRVGNNLPLDEEEGEVVIDDEFICSCKFSVPTKSLLLFTDAAVVVATTATVVVTTLPSNNAGGLLLLLLDLVG